MRTCTPYYYLTSYAGHAGENLAVVRRAAVSLLRRAPGKATTLIKRLRAGWDDDCLLQVL